MAVKTSLTKHLARYGCAIVASLCTTLLGTRTPIWHMAAAEELTVSYTSDACSLRDVTAWQTQLNDPQEEASPDYIYRVTNDFLTACPDRPERREANRIAGMAAVDMGAAETAMRHFDDAGRIPLGVPRFYHMAALLAAGRGQEAWLLRDTTVADWWDRLSYEPTVQLDRIDVMGGTVYAVAFLQPDQETGIKAAWIAVPEGKGWPATLTLGQSRQLTAFHRMRAGEGTAPLRHIDLYRCRGRRLLARTDSDIPMDEAQTLARVALIAYLNDPDGFEPSERGAPLNTCLWPQRLLPTP